MKLGNPVPFIAIIAVPDSIKLLYMDTLGCLCYVQYVRMKIH